MISTITIRIAGQHGSISDLEWPDIPPFAVITGVNGTGKTQLLEIIAAQYGAWRPRKPPYPGPPLLEIQARAEIEGDAFAPGEVFHSYDEWNPLEASMASEEQVKEAISDVYRGATGLDIRPDEIRATIASQRGIPLHEVRNLPLDQFYEDLTPGQLMTFMRAAWSTNLAILFLAYRLFERGARRRTVGRGSHTPIR